MTRTSFLPGDNAPCVSVRFRSCCGAVWRFELVRRPTVMLLGGPCPGRCGRAFLGLGCALAGAALIPVLIAVERYGNVGNYNYYWIALGLPRVDPALRALS